MKRKSTKPSKTATGRSRSASKPRSGTKMGARASSRATVRASGGKSSGKTASGSKASRPASRGGVSAKAKSRVTTGRAAKSKSKPGMSSRAGLKKDLTRMKGRSAVKSNGEMPAKRGSQKAGTTRLKQPMGSSRPVNASTKPSMGSLPISSAQHAPLEERMAPQADKPYTGADAFKPNARGADSLMSAPARKPIRQSRNQVGARHH